MTSVMSKPMMFYRCLVVSADFGNSQIEEEMHRTVQSTSLTEDKLHVFVFPTSLNFYSDDSSTYQAAVTLYNPYDFTIKYKGSN